MFNLSLRDEWISDGVNNKKFCHRLSDDEDEDTEEDSGEFDEYEESDDSDEAPRG